MKIRLSQSEISLARRQTLCLTDAEGVRIAARDGAVWVTQDHDLRDTVLRPGEAVVFDRPGRVIVQALAPARIALSQAVPRRRTAPSAAPWADRLRAAIRRLRAPALASA